MDTFKKKISRFELRKLQTDFPAVKVRTSHEAAKFIRQFYSDDLEIFESFFILTLNQANNTTGYAKISQGGISSTIVDVKLIMKYATDALSNNIVLAHNHPSGNLKPSQEDKVITKKIVNAGKLLDVRICDHIILSAGGYFSFADEGIL